MAKVVGISGFENAIPFKKKHWPGLEEREYRISQGHDSAAVLVVRDGAGYGGLDDIAVDLRTDDHEDPCGELARLRELHELYLTASTDDEKVPIDAELRKAALLTDTGCQATNHPNPSRTATVGTIALRKTRG